MTMPSLIAKHQEKATVVALEKFYNRLEQSLRMNYALDDEDFTPENLLKRFQTVKICKNSKRGCADAQYYFTDGQPNSYWGKNDNEGRTYAILKDGMIIRLSLTSPDCTQTNAGGLQNVCGEISVDVNGKKAPNTAGRDLFYFYLTKRNVVPVGMKEHPSYSFDKCCFNSDYNRGFGCAAWVVYNGNMDYLHCKDKLGWDKASSCKD